MGQISSQLCEPGVTTACLQSTGSVTSLNVLFISGVSGLAKASAPSLTRRIIGISGRPDDLTLFERLGSYTTHMERCYYIPPWTHLAFSLSQ